MPNSFSASFVLHIFHNSCRHLPYEVHSLIAFITNHMVMLLPAVRR